MFLPRVAGRGWAVGGDRSFARRGRRAPRTASARPDRAVARDPHAARPALGRPDSRAARTLRRRDETARRAPVALRNSMPWHEKSMDWRRQSWPRRWGPPDHSGIRMEGAMRINSNFFRATLVVVATIASLT